MANIHLHHKHSNIISIYLLLLLYMQTVQKFHFKQVYIEVIRRHISQMNSYN